MSGPPHCETVGRPINELLALYSQHVNLPMSNHLQLSENITLSCSESSSMIKAANLVLQSGICSLQSVFSQVFPKITYHAGNAKRRLLQMPLVALKIKNMATNRSEIHVTELIRGVDYFKISHFLNATATQRNF